MTDVDDIVARIKRAALDEAYIGRLRAMVAPEKFRPDQPLFTRRMETSSMWLAAQACGRQGYDAGRYADVRVCPYPMMSSPRDTFARRAWLIGYAAGRKVNPRPAPRELTQEPIRIK